MDIDNNANFISFETASSSSWKGDQEPPRATREDETAEGQEDFADLEYWFGSIYFRCVLAQDVFDRVTPGCSFITADSLLLSRLQGFAFRHMLDLCQAQGFQSPLSDIRKRQSQHSTALMLLIGHIVRTRPREQMRDFLGLLRNALGSKQDPSSSDLSPTDEKRKQFSSTNFLNEQMPLKTQEHEAEISRYTSILKEKGDVAGFVPNYNSKQIRMTPPLWEAVVSFQDYDFEGSGRTKQQAKHVASREACKALGLFC